MLEINSVGSFFNGSAEEYQTFDDINRTDQFSDFMYLNDTGLSINGSSENHTDPDWRDNYKPAFDFLLLTILLVVMLSMGCELTWQSVFDHIKKPIGLFVGIFSQFFAMPLSAFCLLLASGIDGLYATGVLIISCCPGGVISNTFTYFCDGDLALSVAMTYTSTLIAMFMMPFNMWLYGRRFESKDLVLPYQKMALSLVTVSFPVIVGMLIKWKLPRVAAIIAKLGMYSMVLLLAICIGLEVILFPDMFDGVPPKLYGIILLIPLLGFTLGYGLATALKRSNSVRKAIAIECGIQNVPVAITIISLSFPIELQKDIILLPWVYSFAMMISCAILCLAYQCWVRYSKKYNPVTREDGTADKLDDILGDDGKTELVSGMKIEIIPSNLKNGKKI